MATIQLVTHQTGDAASDMLNRFWGEHFDELMDGLLDDNISLGPAKVSHEYSAGMEFHQRMFTGQDYLVAFDLELRTFTVLFVSRDGALPTWAAATSLVNAEQSIASVRAGDRVAA